MTDNLSEIGRTKFLWLVSYPKSGNTWMRMLLRNYLEEIEGVRPHETGDTSPYFWQAVSPMPLSALNLEDFVQIRPAAMLHLQTIFASRFHDDRPTAVIKSHTLNASILGVPTFSPLWVDRAVYIYRDPRDIVPSFADHTGGTIDDAIATLANEDAQMGKPPKIPSFLGSWSDHVRSWIMSRDTTQVSSMATSYERMQEDTARELTRVLEFCNIDVDPDAVERAVEAASFENLQAMEDSEGFDEASAKQERFFRRGKVGSHEDELTRAQVAQVEKDHARMMSMLEYL